MKILVTGGAGFIGSHLCERLLKEGHTVKCLDNFYNGNVNNIRGMLTNPRFDFVKGDIRDEELLRRLCSDVEFIFHLAANIHIERSIIHPEETFDINVRGTLKLLKILKENKHIKMVLASSAEVYGSGTHSEKSPANPLSPYAASKVSAEALCRAYNTVYNTDVRIIRNFNTFGPRQKADGYGSVIAIFSKRILNNLPPLLYGSGEQSRSYMYIDDAVENYMIAMKCKPGMLYNVGCESEIRIKDIANVLIKLAGKNLVPVITEPRPGEVQNLCPDISIAKSLGFTPKNTIEEGLTKFFEWFKVHNVSNGYMT
jgi:UDP-glucose 4-epimerase